MKTGKALCFLLTSYSHLDKTMQNDISSVSFPSPSGFSILIHSPIARFLFRFGKRLDSIARPCLSAIHFFMLAATVFILGVVVFLNQHLPCWYDEICMIDPAYQRAVTGIWRSIANWDSFEVVPFAPNYPLHINLLRLEISLFGANFHLLRGSMLFFGLLPVVILLCFFRRKGILQSRREVLCGAYLTTCCTFFYWTAYLRPEAILLSVLTFLVVAWSIENTALLFATAVLVPLCGLHWNVLILPIALYWLFFGGPLRKPLLVALAFALSSAVTIVAYHRLGMWPSYLQEAARVGGLDALGSARAKLVTGWSMGNFYWLFFSLSSFVVLPCVCFAALGFSCRKEFSSSTRSLVAFIVCSLLLVVLSVALFGHLNPNYTFLIPLPVCLLFPIVLRPLVRRHPACFLLFIATVPLFSAWHYWIRLSDTHRNSQWMRLSLPDLAQNCWLDETALEKSLGAVLSENDVVIAPPDVYFALRAFRVKMIPLDWMFNLSPNQFESITALILDAAPSTMEMSQLDAIRAKTGDDHLFDNRVSSTPTPVLSLTPEDYLSVLGRYWHCTFTELPLDPSPRENFIRYRLFRTSFLSDKSSSPPLPSDIS